MATSVACRERFPLNVCLLTLGRWTLEWRGSSMNLEIFKNSTPKLPDFEGVFIPSPYYELCFSGNTGLRFSIESIHFQIPNLRVFNSLRLKIEIVESLVQPRLHTHIYIYIYTTIDVYLLDIIYTFNIHVHIHGTQPQRFHLHQRRYLRAMALPEMGWTVLMNLRYHPLYADTHDTHETHGIK